MAVPGRFFAMLRGRGIACNPCVELGDHYDFHATPLLTSRLTVCSLRKRMP
ncbi:MAG: hypothetical protein V8S69_07130 [Dakarella massiliensis]